ncbi:MAG: hypothetical protein D6701_09180 [Gemmatimonadetes bacterium]|nr:MAG: hypothetical protein D6701_09180 [Gemmatimonadota bacterium]
MRFSPLAQNLWSLGGLVFWLVAYVLMIRRGVRDRSYSMPVIGLAFNVAWELYYSVFSQAPAVERIGVGMYLALDLGVLWTCFRFGPEDFRSDLVRRWFRPGLAVMLGTAFLLIRQFAIAFNDEVGHLSASIIVMVYSMLLIAMLLRRDSVRGQSLYIAICILMGDLCGAFMGLAAQQNLGADAGMVAWIVTANAVILACNVLYLTLYVRLARRDGVPLWSRA